MQRVVVTGMGLVSPLGVGLEYCWNALLKGRSGIVSVKDRPGFGKLPCTIAGLVPEGRSSEESFVFDWDSLLNKSERRQVSRGIGFALKGTLKP